MSEKAKERYDALLKEIYLETYPERADSFPYSERYAHYFKPSVLHEFVARMDDEAYRAYRHSPGKELEAKKNGVPPKMLSIASSSAFCLASLAVKGIGTGADFFTRTKGSIKKAYFEKELPVFPSFNCTPPTMDGYAEGAGEEYFFECKCHEIFDEHPILLSKNYFKSERNLIVKRIPKEWLSDVGKNMKIDPKAFGLSGDSPFDAKQLLTHIMGIQCNKKDGPGTLIYLFYLPESKRIREDEIKRVIDQALLDAKTVFESDVVRECCKENRISLRLYVKHDAVNPCDATNTEEVYRCSWDDRDQ
ncbi:MAG: hypothetical protein K6F32_00985 [Bacilli bacterium]|nr:hypothetical protein [Bacilli bacterium]